jgi:hypothetical protein
MVSFNPYEVSVAMPTPAVLDDLIDALEEQSDTLFPFLDRETGEVVMMSDESLSLAEADPEKIELLPDWQQEEAKVAVLIETSDRYLALPDRLDVNEWNIMNQFSQEVKREDIRFKLLRAVQGNHAFRRFKDVIADHNMWDEWNRFRREAFAEILREWCEEIDVIPTVREKQTARRKN